MDEDKTVVCLNDTEAKILTQIIGDIIDHKTELKAVGTAGKVVTIFVNRK